mmetsp:Transcript_26456/g.39140  ORF Transcript_26456/g.39140 Transcript_26456/m.39140 type:complete len:95 (-) Transcript_26456:150-434(-)
MLYSTIRPATRTMGQRFKSAKASEYFLNAKKKESFRKNWLSDPSCYPLIVVMGAAGCLVTGVIGSCLLFSPDVQIAQKKRGAVIRTWGLPGFSG